MSHNTTHASPLGCFGWNWSRCWNDGIGKTTQPLFVAGAEKSSVCLNIPKRVPCWWRMVHPPDIPSLNSTADQPEPCFESIRISASQEKEAKKLHGSWIKSTKSSLWYRISEFRIFSLKTHIIAIPVKLLIVLNTMVYWIMNSEYRKSYVNACRMRLFSWQKVGSWYL